MNTLRTTRRSRGLTQAEVAASARISLPTLRALERGEGGVQALVAVMAVLDSTRVFRLGRAVALDVAVTGRCVAMMKMCR